MSLARSGRLSLARFPAQTDKPLFTSSRTHTHTHARHVSIWQELVGWHKGACSASCLTTVCSHSGGQGGTGPWPFAQIRECFWTSSFPYFPSTPALTVTRCYDDSAGLTLFAESFAYFGREVLHFCFKSLDTRAKLMKLHVNICTFKYHSKLHNYTQ